MKNTLLICALSISSFAFAQQRPRIFVSGKGTENVSTNANSGGNHWFRSGRADSTIGAHDESMEVTKDFQKNCPGVIITINQAAADYTVMLDRESKQNRGLLRSNSQIQVANRLGDVLGSSATHTVSNAAKDACELILADWAQNGKIAPVAPAAQPIPVQPQPANQTAAPVSFQPAAAAPTAENTGTRGATLIEPSSEVSSVAGDQTSLGDAARAARAAKQ